MPSCQSYVVDLIGKYLICRLGSDVKVA